MASPTQSNTETNHSWYAYFQQKGSELYEQTVNPKTKDEEVKQECVLAGARGVVQVVSIALQPLAAGVGVVATAKYPEQMKSLTTTADGAITGFWNALSPKQKLLAATSGVFLAYVGSNYLPIPIVTGALSFTASVFAFKIGSELVQKNLQKQQIATQIAKIQ